MQIRHMKKVELVLVALTNSEMEGSGYVVVLREKEGQRRLPVVIGAMEAQSIIQGSESEPGVRPMAHDALQEILQHSQIFLSEVSISSLEDQVFHATLIYRNGAQEIAIDARTSDALALAIRAGCPIYTTPKIMQEASVSWEPGVSPDRTSFSEMPRHDLEDLLQEALEAEDFERAAQLRDELSRRQQ